MWDEVSRVGQVEPKQACREEHLTQPHDGPGVHDRQVSHRRSVEVPGPPELQTHRGYAVTDGADTRLLGRSRPFDIGRCHGDVRAEAAGGERVKPLSDRIQNGGQMGWRLDHQRTVAVVTLPIGPAATTREIHTRRVARQFCAAPGRSQPVQLCKSADCTNGSAPVPTRALSAGRPGRACWEHRTASPSCS